MFTYLGICVARLVYAGFPACELRDTVTALACMFARGGSANHGSLTHVCPSGVYTTRHVSPGGIYARRFLDTHLAGWDLYEPRGLDPFFV